MDDIVKIVKSLEDAGLLIKSVGKRLKMKEKNILKIVLIGTLH